MTSKLVTHWIVVLILVFMLALTMSGAQASVQKSNLARSITMGITERVSVASDETQANEYYLPLIINNSNVNLARKSISLSARSVWEDSPDNTIIGTLSSLDPDENPLTFVLLDNAGGRFKISGTELQVADSSLLDYETATSHSITVQTSGSYDFLTIYVIPQVDLRVGQVITVTTDSDAQNGNVISIDALLADPGPDGISLREAIAASNNTSGPETIEFAPVLKGAVIYVGSSVSEFLLLFDGELIINGDIDGDGNPDITLDGSLASHVQSGLTIGSSHNTIHALNIVDFPSVGIALMPLITGDCTERVLYGNKIVRNVVSGTPGAGITTQQAGMGNDASASGLGWEDTLIVENDFTGTMNVSIYLMAAYAGGSRNRIVNSTVVRNHISGADTGINVYAADTASDWISFPPEIRDLIPVVYSDDNVISHTLIVDNIIDDVVYHGIHISSSGSGNRGNVVQDVKIVGNTILRTEQSLLVLTASGSGSRTTTDNRISDMEIVDNIIEDTSIGIQLGVGDGFGPVDQTVSGVLDDINNNQLQDILIRNNLITGYQYAGLFLWGGKTDSDEKTYGMSNNAAQRLTIQNNQFMATGNGTTGILVMGGWGYGGRVTVNSIEDLDISKNNIYDDNIAIWLIGGKEINAVNNIVSIIALQGNTGPISIDDNIEGATGNTVETPTP